MTKKRLTFKIKSKVQKKLKAPEMSIVTFNFGTLQGIYNAAMPDRYLMNNNV